MKTVFTKVELIGASIEGLTQVADLVTPLSDDQWHADTPCPGWKVSDVVAHLADFESFLSGNQRALVEPDWASLPHVLSEIGRFNELGVEARRGTSQAELIAELRELIELRRTILSTDTSDLTSQVRGPFGGPITLERALTMRGFDTWIHEQDIRDAIGQPGGWTGLPFEVALSVLINALPVVWGKNSQPSVDAVLNVEISDLASGIFVRFDDDGRARFTESEEPTVQLTISVSDLVHLMCGRIATNNQEFLNRISLTGPDDLVQRFMVGMAVTP